MPHCVLPLIGLVFVAAALQTGCGKKSDGRPQRVPVSGVVVHKGQPVPDAAVLFEPAGSSPAATGQTDASGRYQLTTFEPNDGAVPGDYKVAVRKVQVVRSNSQAEVPDDFVGPPPDEKWLLPTKYGYGESSGLTATVKENTVNDFKLELQE